MAVTKQQVVLEFDADTSELVKATKQVEKSVGNVDKNLEGVGKAAKKSGKGLSKMGKTGSKAFKAVGTALKATGIGLIVALVAKLAQKFAENKKVADILNVALAGLGAVFNTIIDAGTWVVDNLVAAFKNPQEAVEGLRDRLFAFGDYLTTLRDAALIPFQILLLKLKEGFISAAIGAKEFFGSDASELREQLGEVKKEQEDLAKSFGEKLGVLAEPFVEAAAAVSNYVKETASAVKNAANLEKQLQKLKDRERELRVETAEATAAVEELKRQRDDERLSIEDRIAAAEKAAEIDQKRADEQVAIAQKRERLLRQELELQGETEERLDALAEAQIAAADARAASAGVQTELMTSLISLDNERLAQMQAIKDAENERLEGIMERQTEIDMILATAREREETALREWYNEQRRLANENGQILVGLEEAYAKKQAELQDKYNDEDLAKEKAVLDQKRQMTFAALSALQSLNAAFSSADEEGARRAFKRNKALSLASAVLNTGQAITDALKGPELFPGGRFIEAAITGAAGLAQIQNIRKTQFQGSTPPPPATEDRGPAGGFATGAVNAPGAPTLDLGFLGEGAQGGPIQAYVIAQNVSNAQQANQQVQDQATLGG